MELRHTLEILTKDIQDIGKLVGNLQNSEGSHRIDLDLALSKLRNVYEVLTMIREDRYQELIGTGIPQPDHPEQEQAEKEETRQVRSVTESLPEPEEETQAVPQDEKQSVPQEEASDEVKGDPVGDVQKEVSKAAPKVVPAPPPGSKPILAERFSASSSINDNLAGKRPAGTESRLAGKPIDSIHRNIGINDRFLIIRELFEGNADSFRELVQQLDEAGDFQHASQLLQQRFPENPEHEGIGILEGLIKRRYTPV